MLKTLGAQIKEFKKDSIKTPLFMILEVLMEMLIPFLMASIIDDGVEKGDIRHICIIGGWMIVAALIGLYAGIMGGVCGANASAGFARNLRKAMYENIQQFSFSNIDRFSTAGLITRLTTDVTNVQNAYQMLLRMFVRAPISMVCAMIMSFYINAKLASIYLVAVIILGACLFFIISRVSGYFQEVFKKYDDLNASVQENIAGIRVVKAYVREDYEDKKFSKASYNVYKMFVKAEKILSYNAPLMQFAVYSCILGISWLGAKMIVTDQLTTGELMSLLTYCMNILMSLMMVSMVFVMVSMSVASAERITEVLEEKPELTNPERPVTEVKDGSIVFDHVNFSYKKGNGEYVLKDINLNVHAGETIGIIGGTGSAKSSLVNLISRLYDVTTGSIKVGGMDLRWGNKEASKEECIRACQLACADEFIEKMPEGYETYIEQGGSNVSGGQKQRLCIARALLKKPKVLILDDSTSAVDTATDARIREAFAKEIPGTTKLIIAQRISSVQGADRIIVMNDGQVDGFGTHGELLANNQIYREVYESQTQGGGDFDEKGGV